MTGPTTLGVPHGASGKRHKVVVVGSGNWGSTISKIVAENTRQHSDIFEPEVQMWVFEEEVTIAKDSPHYDNSTGDKPQKLTTVINKYHENVKYLPGIRLPDNLIANPSLVDAASGASILIFNLPHQFIGKACATLKGHIVPFARGISCIKGVEVSDDGVHLFSEWIGESLGIYCGALSGANIAPEIAAEKWCGTTIAYDPPPMDQSRAPSRAGSRAPSRAPSSRSGTPPNGGARDNGSSSKPLPLTAVKAGDAPADLTHRDVRGRKSKVKLTPVPVDYPPLDHETFRTLFHRPYFHVRVVSDVAGVSLGGALKNVVALAAGFVVGRGWGDNAKSEIIRVGLLEMIKFGNTFFKETIAEETFTVESAGVADLITSCSSGRNFRCAKMAVEKGVSVEEIERTELNGQMLQGTSTAKEVNNFLKRQGMEQEYPLFTTVNGILEGRYTVDDIPNLVSDSA